MRIVLDEASHAAWLQYAAAAKSESGEVEYVDDEEFYQLVCLAGSLLAMAGCLTDDVAPQREFDIIPERDPNTGLVARYRRVPSSCS